MEVDEFFHSSEKGGGSDPDNQNKQKVRVDLGIDPESGKRLYDLHERRAQRGSLRSLYLVFRASQFATRLRERTKTPRRPHGVSVGWRQFIQSKCACIQERKPSECDCQDCTYIIENLRKWHKARRGWHHSLLASAGGAPCSCNLHNVSQFKEAVNEARDAEAAAWNLAAEVCAEASIQGWQAEAASARAREVEALFEAALLRRQHYDNMSCNTDALLEALLPCGKISIPTYSVTGERPFRMYPRECAHGNCPNRVFRAASACGWDRRFGAACPIEASEDPYSWFVWEQRVRGQNSDGEPSYSPEFVPKHGTRKEFLAEFRSKLAQWIPHDWREKLGKQGLRVFEDRKSGRHLHAAYEKARKATLLVNVLEVVLRVNPTLWHLGYTTNATAHAAEVWIPMQFRGTLTALNRIARLDAHSTAAQLTDAEEGHNRARETATVQSDYAAQLETQRLYTATCASRERHNFLVVIVGYKPYKQDVPQGAGRRKCAQAAMEEYRQHVDVFFAFHVAGFKASARSFNVVREDIDHWLKHGSFLHGEWFTGGQRCPGGDHTKSLPPTLSERVIVTPDFPEYEVRHALVCSLSCVYCVLTMRSALGGFRLLSMLLTGLQLNLLTPTIIIKLQSGVAKQ